MKYLITENKLNNYIEMYIKENFEDVVDVKFVKQTVFLASEDRKIESTDIQILIDPMKVLKGNFQMVRADVSEFRRRVWNDLNYTFGLKIEEYGLAAQSAQDQSFFDQPGKFVIQPVRVRFTFLDPVAIKNDYPKLFEKYGSYDTLGGILFEPFTNPIVPVSDVFEDNLIYNYNFAKPLFPNIRQVHNLANTLTLIVDQVINNSTVYHFVDYIAVGIQGLGSFN